MSFIEVQDLVKRYHRSQRTAGNLGAVRGLFSRRRVTTVALDGISFAAERGELIGYIGPNGAGKSTTVKVLTGILVPDEGRCLIDGRVPWEQRREHVSRIGVVFGQRTQLWWDLPLIESFDLLRDIYRIAPAAYESSRDELIDLLGVSAFLDQPVRQLSLGQRMRADLVASLLHQPDILFLDEPTIGLDAPGKLAIREFIRTINRERGVTVMLTSHDMDDIEALCTRLMVIGKGRIVADGSPNILHEEYGLRRRVVVDVEPFDTVPDSLSARLSTSDASLIVEESRLTFEVSPSRLPVPELIDLVSSSFVIRDLFVSAPPIEQIVSRIYETNHA